MTAFKDRVGNKLTRVKTVRWKNVHDKFMPIDPGIMVCVRTLLLQVRQISKLNGQQQTKRPAKSSSFETRVRSACWLSF